MQYLLMIYTDEQQDAQRTPEEHEANMGEYFAFTNAVREAGVMVAGEADHIVLLLVVRDEGDGRQVRAVGTRHVRSPVSP